MLLCTAQGFVEGKTIQGSYLHMVASDASFGSAGIASSVVVRGNLFVDTNADTGIWESDSPYSVFRDLTFASNSFVGESLTTSNAGSLLVAGNYFEKRNGHDHPKDQKSFVVKCAHAFQPIVFDNIELSSAAHDFNLVKTQTEGLRAKDNTVVVSASLAGP